MAERKAESLPVPQPIPGEAVQYVMPIELPETCVIPINIPIYASQLGIISVPQPVPKTYAIPINIPIYASQQHQLRYHSPCHLWVRS